MILEELNKEPKRRTRFLVKVREEQVYTDTSGKSSANFWPVQRG